MERKKGQIELVAIAGLIIIVLIVIFLIMQQFMVQPPITPGTGSEVKTVKDSINNFIQAGLMDVLVKIYSQGGYSNLAGVQGIDFSGTKVPVWQACEKLSIPEVENEISIEVGKYIKNNLKDEIMFFGKNVKIDIPAVTAKATILKDSVKVEVYLPTYVEGNEVPIPYIVSVDSNLKEILEFSSNFVTDSSENRFFELITLITMFYTDSDNPYWTPVLGVRSDCGAPIVKRREEILAGMVKVAEYVASHAVWDKKPARSAENPFYPINTVGGKRYDLDVMFSYPESWDMDGNFEFGPDPFVSTPKPMKIEINKPIKITLPVPRMCMDVYGVTYSFKYPIIVSVRDDVINQWFKFALLSEVRENAPGDCIGDLDDPNTGYAKEICINQSKCGINFTVIDNHGNPVEGADVFFYECDLGKTDSQGRMINYVPCGISEVKVYKNGYKAFGNFTSYYQLSNTTIILGKTHNMTVHFYGVPMEGFNPNYDPESTTTYIGYRATGEPKPITDFSNTQVDITFKPKYMDIFTGEDSNIMETNQNFTSGEMLNNVTVDGVMYNEYTLVGKAYDTSSNRNENYVDLGHNNGTMKIENQTDLYVYYPVVEKWVWIPGHLEGDMANSLDINEIEKLRRKFGYCGIEFFSFAEQTSFNLGGAGCNDWTV